MNNPRHEILSWAEQGHLHPADLPAILAQHGITPARRDWRVFFDRIMLWLGVIFLAAGVIFFVAANWADLGRFAKFGLVQALIVASLLPLWRFGLERREAKAGLLLTCLLIGALLALIGQTYQTGADTFELFGVWALAILPLVLVAHSSPIWMLWLVLLNLTLHLYFTTFGSRFDAIFDSQNQLWTLFTLNLVAWCASFAALQWRLIEGALVGSRAVLVWCIALLTTLVIWSIFDSDTNNRALAGVVYVAWLPLMYYVYRMRWPDLLALAANALSGIVVSSALLIRIMFDKTRWEGVEFLVIGLFIIVMSSLAGLWLKAVAKEIRA